MTEFSPTLRVTPRWHSPHEGSTSIVSSAIRRRSDARKALPLIFELRLATLHSLNRSALSKLQVPSGLHDRGREVDLDSRSVALKQLVPRCAMIPPRLRLVARTFVKTQTRDLHGFTCHGHIRVRQCFFWLSEVLRVTCQNGLDGVRRNPAPAGSFSKLAVSP